MWQFKSGELKESELMEEAQEIMGKMKDMPGLKEMMSKMGMDAGGKFDFKGMANKMQQNMKQSKTKERMNFYENKKIVTPKMIRTSISMSNFQYDRHNNYIMAVTITENFIINNVIVHC